MTTINAADLRKDLQMTLEHVKDKRPGDGRWVYVKSSGQLDLYSRPSNVFRIIECIKRIYFAFRGINPYGALDTRLTLLASQVNDYLKAEKDMKSLNDFLITYNPALNSLFYAQQRMAKARNIAAPDLSKFKALSDLCYRDTTLPKSKLKMEYSFVNTSHEKAVYFNDVKVDPQSRLDFETEPADYYKKLQADVLVRDDTGSQILKNVPFAFKTGRVEISYPPAVTAYATVESDFCAQLGASQHLCISYDTNEGLKHVITDEGPRRISLKNNSDCTVEVWVTIKGAKDTYEVSSFVLTPQEGLDKSFDHFIDWIEEQFPEKQSERWIANALKQEVSLTFEVALTEMKR